MSLEKRFLQSMIVRKTFSANKIWVITLIGLLKDFEHNNTPAFGNYR